MYPFCNIKACASVSLHQSHTFNTPPPLSAQSDLFQPKLRNPIKPSRNYKQKSRTKPAPKNDLKLSKTIHLHLLHFIFHPVSFLCSLCGAVLRDLIAKDAYENITGHRPPYIPYKDWALVIAIYKVLSIPSFMYGSSLSPPPITYLSMFSNSNSNYAKKNNICVQVSRPTLDSYPYPKVLTTIIFSIRVKSC